MFLYKFPKSYVYFYRIIKFIPDSFINIIKKEKKKKNLTVKTDNYRLFLILTITRTNTNFFFKFFKSNINFLC